MASIFLDLSRPIAWVAALHKQERAAQESEQRVVADGGVRLTV